jgi:hypothetical protein
MKAPPVTRCHPSRRRFAASQDEDRFRGALFRFPAAVFVATAFFAGFFAAFRPFARFFDAAR